MKTLFAIAGVFLYLAPVPRAFAAPLSPREFVRAAPAALFYTEDEMSEEEKKTLLQSMNPRRKKFNCSSWGISQENKERLVMQRCTDSRVIVQLYQNEADQQNTLVAVASERGSGRSSELAFFTFSQGQKDPPQQLTEAQLQKIGLTPLTENDFLLDKERFPLAEAEPVPISLGDSGELIGNLDVWMNPRWEQRSQAYEVQFKWKNGRFERIATAVK
jgi:hypothetical protein